MKTASTWRLALVLLLAASACGPNVFKPYDTSDPAEEAAVALEDNDPNRAIRLLDAALEDDPENAEFLAMLGAAYAHRAGIDTISLLEALAQPSEDSSNPFAAFYSILPEGAVGPFDTNVKHDLETAVKNLEKIPADERDDAASLLLALIDTALLSLLIRDVDTDGVPGLSAGDIVGMSATDASDIVTYMASSANALPYAGATACDPTKSEFENLSMTQQAGCTMHDAATNNPAMEQLNNR